MSWLLMFLGSAGGIAGVAAALYVRQPKLAYAAAAIGIAAFASGYLIGVGEDRANTKIERQNNNAIREGQTGARNARGCGPDSVFDIASGNCIRLGAGGRY
jgi:hypothetical protein